jgi:hypothetical protein
MGWLSGTSPDLLLRDIVRRRGSRAVGSCADGPDQIPLRFERGGPPWTRAPGARRGPRRAHASSAVGSEIHGAAAALFLKSP